MVPSFRNLRTVSRPEVRAGTPNNAVHDMLRTQEPRASSRIAFNEGSWRTPTEAEGRRRRQDVKHGSGLSQLSSRVSRWRAKITRLAMLGSLENVAPDTLEHLKRKKNRRTFFGERCVASLLSLAPLWLHDTL